MGDYDSFHYVKYDQNCIYTYIYVNVFYYKQRSLLHVSATCCGHLQGDVH